MSAVPAWNLCSQPFCGALPPRSKPLPYTRHQGVSSVSMAPAGFPSFPPFPGRHVQLRVRKRAGMETEDVLDPGAGKSVWGKLFGGGKSGECGTTAV